MSIIDDRRKAHEDHDKQTVYLYKEALKHMLEAQRQNEPEQQARYFTVLLEAYKASLESKRNMLFKFLDAEALKPLTPIYFCADCPNKPI